MFKIALRGRKKNDLKICHVHVHVVHVNVIIHVVHVHVIIHVVHVHL